MDAPKGLVRKSHEGQAYVGGDSSFYASDAKFFCFRRFRKRDGTSLGPQDDLFRRIASGEGLDSGLLSYVVQDVISSDRVRRSYVASSVERFLREYTAMRPTERHCYEIVRSGARRTEAGHERFAPGLGMGATVTGGCSIIPVKLIFDVEFTAPHNDHLADLFAVDDPEKRAASRQAYSRLVKDYIRDRLIFPIVFGGDAAEVAHFDEAKHLVELDASNATKKFSRHYIYNLEDASGAPILFTSLEDQRSLVWLAIRDIVRCTDCDELYNGQRVCGSCDKKASPLLVMGAADLPICVIDRAIYTKNRVFRMYGSNKEKEHGTTKRVLRRVDPVSGAVVVGSGLDTEYLKRSLVTYQPPGTRIGRLLSSTIEPNKAIFRRGSSMVATDQTRPASVSAGGTSQASTTTTTDLNGFFMPVVDYMNTKVDTSHFREVRFDRQRFRIYIFPVNRVCGLATPGKPFKHSSNNIKWVVNLLGGTYQQGCFSRKRQECCSLGPPHDLPEQFKIYRTVSKALEKKQATTDDDEDDSDSALDYDFASFLNVFDVSQDADVDLSHMLAYCAEDVKITG